MLKAIVTSARKLKLEASGFSAPTCHPKDIRGSCSTGYSLCEKQFQNRKR